MKRAALYARVSTKGQADNYSFGMQEADGESYVQKQADQMKITHRLVEVKSGRTLDREELNKLFILIKNREIDAVVVGKLDRLSRNVAQLSMIAETCQEYGVELHYADFGKDENTPMGRMIRNMRGSYAEFEADIIYERTQGAREEAMRTRILGASPKAPYGHMYIGKGKDKLLVLNSEEADTIKLMRDWLLRDGLGTPSIATRLTRMGIPTPGAKLWNSTEWSASGAYRILTSPSIAGTYYHGRYKRAKRGDKYAKLTDSSEWQAFPCDPIISQEDFDAIQRKLADNRDLSKRNTKRFYLLGRRIRCGCGASLTGDNHGTPRRRIYRCIASKVVSPRTCTPLNSVNADRIEDFVWKWLLTQLEPANLKAGLLAERERATEITDELRRQLAIQERQLTELDGRLNRIQQGFNGGFYTLEEALLQKEQVAPAIKSVKEERDRLIGLIEAGSRSDEDDLALMLEAEELYREALSVEEPERKRWFIDRLDVRVVVERIGQERKVTMSCLLGTSKGNSFLNISI